MKTIYVAYYPGKVPEVIMTKSEKVRDEIKKKSPLLQFEKVEIANKLYNKLPETVLQQL